MIDKHAMSNLKKMWTWLCCHPAHDRSFYASKLAVLAMKHMRENFSEAR
ncbi:MAG: hypothetical protein KJP19_04970 [Deltaproteobacteria bacterium]|nr:hypothetical protein [Deltaproteobacteria bacterium]